MTTSGPQARVAGSGSYLPPHAIDNYELFARPSIQAAFDVDRARGSLRDIAPEEASALEPADVFHRWALQVTGIARRRIGDGSAESTAEAMCAEAGRRALAQAGMEARDLDLIIAGSLTADDVVPNLACTVAHLLGVPHVGGYVLNAACAGFVAALAAGYGHLVSGGARNVLVVSGDALSLITNYSDPTTAVLFGDGACALILSAERGPGRVLAAPYLVADYSPDHLNLKGQGWPGPPDPRPKLGMAGGPHVLRQAIKAMVDVAERALERAEVHWDDVDVVIPHQANRRITQGIARTLRLAKGRVIDQIEDYGNVSASTVGIALDEVLRGKYGALPDPARIVLTAVGGGYTSAAAVLEWSPSPSAG